MGLFGSTGKRLRTGPVVAFSYDPGRERLFQELRAFDPGSEVHKDVIRVAGCMAGRRLEVHGPVQVTPALAGEMSLSPLLTCAYSVKGTVADGANDLVRGLALRLDGTARPARDILVEQGLEDQVRAGTNVWSPRPIGPGELMDLLRPYAGDLALEPADEDGIFELTGSLRAGSTPILPLRPPLAADLGPDAVDITILSNQPVHEADSREIQRIADAARTVAAAVGGIPTDLYGFAL